MRSIVLGLLVTIAACDKAGKSAGAGASADPKATVTGFIEAMAAGDLEAAGRYLPGDEMCAGAPAEHKAGCLDGLKAQRAKLSELVDEWPKGAKVKSVEPAGGGDMPPGLAEWMVVLVVDGKEQETGALTMEYAGKHYATYAMSKDDQSGQ